VAAIEGGSRVVSTDELVGLALVLGVLVGELLDPDDEDLNFGGPVPIPVAVAELWARGGTRLQWRDGRLGMRPIPTGLAEYLKWAEAQGMREPMGEYRDYLTERVHGKPAREEGPND
jgi:hypothetical protein